MVLRETWQQRGFFKLNVQILYLFGGELNGIGCVADG